MTNWTELRPVSGYLPGARGGTGDRARKVEARKRSLQCAATICVGHQGVYVEVIKAICHEKEDRELIVTSDEQLSGAVQAVKCSVLGTRDFFSTLTPDLKDLGNAEATKRPQMATWVWQLSRSLDNTRQKWLPTAWTQGFRCDATGSRFSLTHTYRVNPHRVQYP